MKRLSPIVVSLAVFGLLAPQFPAQAAKLPVAAFKPLKLAPYVAKAGAIGYIIPLVPAHLEGVIRSVEGTTLIITDEEGTDYTVDIEQAAVLNYAGKKAKRDILAEGDLVVVDGYLARNSTGMTARRVIDAGPAPKKPALE